MLSTSMLSWRDCLLGNVLCVFVVRFSDMKKVFDVIELGRALDLLMSFNHGGTP